MQIHAATRRGDIDGIRYCLARGVDVDARNLLKETPLLAALESLRAFGRGRGPQPSLETICFLLDAGADLKAQGDYGGPAVHAAAQSGSLELLQLIEARGGDLHQMTEHGYTTLLHACYQPPSPAKLAMLRHIAEHGVPLDLASHYGESPLGVCLYFGDFAAARLLLDLGANSDVLGWTPLHRALVLDPAGARTLPPTHAELEQRIPHPELTPLLLACKVGDLESVVWLAECGADLQATGRGGMSALHFAAQHDRLEVLEWLLNQGADLNLRNDARESPLMEACEHNSLRCLVALLQRGASVRAANHVGMQAIHHAQTLDALKILVESSQADLNVVDGCGDWPLKLAAENNDIPGLQWLLDQGAQIDLTSTGATALHAAISRDAREAAHLLLASGANVNAPDVDGWTPLFNARSREMIALLLAHGADPAARDLCDDTAAKWLKDPLLSEMLA